MDGRELEGALLLCSRRKTEIVRLQEGTARKLFFSSSQSVCVCRSPFDCAVHSSFPKGRLAGQKGLGNFNFHEHSLLVSGDVCLHVEVRREILQRNDSNASGRGDGHGCGWSPRHGRLRQNNEVSCSVSYRTSCTSFF